MVDLTAEIGQPVAPIGSLDREGRMPGEWLELRRRYYFHLTGPEVPKGGVRGAVVWDGRLVIDAFVDLKPVKHVPVR
jgi:hypothetical protein